MVNISFLWDGGGSILYGIIYWPPFPPSPSIIKDWQLQSRIQWHICFIISTIYRSLFTKSMLIVQIKFGRVGVKILWYNILTPPPPPPNNIQEQYFENGIQWQLSFKTQNIYISQTILFCGWHFFFIGWGGGGGGQYIMV